MQYYSLNHSSPKVNFREAAIRGQAPDKGLYFPESIPVLPSFVTDNITNLSKEELAFLIINPYVGDTINESTLREIVAETINFDFPLVKVNDRISSLELFHGPTLAFKDVGARFMSRCLGYFLRSEKKQVTVLVATSGDTGGAVANGFYGVEGINVVILYPSGKVSSVQELQLTTLGKNISALEVDGNFDDCQSMVKQAFSDPLLKSGKFLTSANSINVARWLPQQFYYFFALQQWPAGSRPPVIAVPSGNFGNICAGILAYRSGLPVNHFIAANNANDTVPVFLNTGSYQPKKAIATISNAMDVGDPSNFVRVLEIFNNELENLKTRLSSYSVSDEQTRDTIRKVFTESNYLTDPHGAVAYFALERYLDQHPGEQGIFLETAHPVKFYDTVEQVTGKKVPVPESIASLDMNQKKSIPVKASYPLLREFLLSQK